MMEEHQRQNNVLSESMDEDECYYGLAAQSSEPFVHICGGSYVERSDPVIKVIVYSNMPEVSLYKDGLLMETQSGRRKFTFLVPIEGEHSILARAGNCRSVILVRRVSFIWKNRDGRREMTRKGIQQFMLGSVMNNELQARETLRSVKEAGYDGIELCGFMIHPTGLMVRMMTKAAGMPTGNGGKLDWHALIEDSGLGVISLHTDLGSLERDAAAAAAEAKSFGTDTMVITAMYRFDYGNEEEIHKLAQRLNRAGEALASEGIRLLYHNHNVELTRVNKSRRVYDILMEETDPEYVNFEFDSYWFAEGGADPLSWMQRLGSRMKLWHINDRGARLTGTAMTPILSTDSMELGTGNMPLDALMEQALSVDVEAVVLESHKNWIDKSPVKSLQVSAEYLKEKIG